MRIYIVTDKEGSCFKNLSGGQDNPVVMYTDSVKLRRLQARLNDDDIIYLDWADIENDRRLKDLGYLQKKQGVLWGIIDRKNELNDPAGLIRQGACDYIGSRLYKTVSGDRFLSILESRSLPASVPAKKQSDAAKNGKMSPCSGLNWDNIKPGSEYRFIMLYTEMNLPQDLKRKAGNDHLGRLKAAFEDLVSRTVAEAGGRIWIWNEYGGLALFPFDGSCSISVIPALRLYLNRRLYSIEYFNMQTPVSYRIAVHAGATEYRERGDTGKIISDSVNFIFHLGAKYSPEDSLVVSGDYLSILPDKTRKLFCPPQEFEGQSVYIMK